MKKIRIAFIKFGGMAKFGTEKVLQTVASGLDSNKYEVDYFYCDAAPYIGSDYKHADTDPHRLKYMEKTNVNLIKFNVGFKDIRVYTHDWIDTNFWDVFEEENYDIIQTGRSGHSEYPFCHIHKTPIVDSLHLVGHVETKHNVKKTILISKFQADRWIEIGGDASKVIIIPNPVDVIPKTTKDFRKELNIPASDFVFGLHQRDDDGIYSDIPLSAFAQLKKDNVHFVILGGSEKYKNQANNLSIKNVHFLPLTGDIKIIHKFLQTLDAYGHGRADGEVCSTALIEALYHGLPIVTHTAASMGHLEQVENVGIMTQNTEEYYDGMCKLLKETEYYKKCQENALKKYDEVYKTEQILRRYSDVYEQIVGNKVKKKFNQVSFSNHNKEYVSSVKLELEKEIHSKMRYSNYANLYQDDHPQGRDLDRYTHLKNAIDVGCGTGWFASYLINERGFEKVYAIEPSKAALDMAKEIVNSARNIKWINGYAEEEIHKLNLKEPTFFNFMCVLAHMPDDLAEEVCKAVDIVAPIGSVASFSEPWGEYHNDINDCWHIRPKQWWQNIFKNWNFEFYEDYPLSYGRYKGFTAVREK